MVNDAPSPFDPQKTMLAPGARGAADAPSPPTPFPAPGAPPLNQPPPQYASPGQPPPPQWQPPAGQQPPPAWTPQPQQPAQNWGAQQPPQNWDTPYQQPAAFGAPGGGRSRALAIAALTFGACAATIMVLLIFRHFNLYLEALVGLSIIGIALGVTALVLSVRNRARYGGLELSVAGLAMGLAALIYYFIL
jgi:hypothetical protein